jgi:hypothetical protein
LKNLTDMFVHGSILAGECMPEIHVLVVTEDEKSRLVTRLKSELPGCIVKWVAPQEIPNQMITDRTVFTNCDYHIVSDAIHYIPSLSEYMLTKISRDGMFKHILIAVIDSPSERSAVCRANAIFEKEEGIGPIVRIIRSAREENFDGRADTKRDKNNKKKPRRFGTFVP